MAQKVDQIPRKEDRKKVRKEEQNNERKKDKPYLTKTKETAVEKSISKTMKLKQSSCFSNISSK